ncbi:hypothetical protein KIW84_041944 [Lathyrus oleraceus]|uniref:RRM domain-containing protein n=1 Tax=Pisum sativum TaxID=3888 RepID=A0A9D4XBP3_PEA|nr:hypothetical protein KIW84_041944 [Pisum sativum]
MNKFSGYELDGKLLSVSKEEPIREEPKKPTYPRAYSSSSPNIICVENLLEDRLADMFSRHGKVEDIEINFKARSGKSRAYIIMNNESDMNNVIAAINGHVRILT